jgi:NodT family efflux transporter outer membrane factor (OMF) lipoprotein
MSRTATLLVLLSIVAATAGCASTGRVNGQQKAVAPQSLAFQQKTAGDSVFVDGDWPAANWWSAFADPKLDALITQALADNPGLHIAEARVRAAADLAQVARSALFPTLDFNAAGTRQRASDNVVAAGDLRGLTVNGARVALDFNYEFDFWGRNRDQLKAALGEVRAADADSEAARLVLATAVAQTYFQLQTDVAAADVAKETLGERTGLRELNLQRVSRGLQSNIPSRQSDQQVASSRVDVTAAEAAVQLDRHQLATLLGMGPGATLDVEMSLTTRDQPLPLPTDLPANLLARRPDVAAERFRVEAAAERIGVARADFYPNVNLAAFFGFEALQVEGLHLFSSGSRAYGATPAIHLPLFEGGRLRANLRGRYDEYDAAVAQYNQTLIDALRQVADNMVGLRAVRQQLTDQADARAAAADAYRLTLDRYRAGLTNYLDVLVNEERLLAERQKQVQLQGRSLALRVGMIRALGGGYRAPEMTSEGT